MRERMNLGWDGGETGLGMLKCEMKALIELKRCGEASALWNKENMNRFCVYGYLYTTSVTHYEIKYFSSRNM